ncbi:MAG: hypothetical protein IJN94_05750, partial [Clostridia bacterium]|nr:hypothetical protein [Clostridia bacterium]
TFSSADLKLSEESKTEEFVVTVDMSGISQEYFTLPTKNFAINNPEKEDYRISALNKSVVVVGAVKDLESVTEEDIKVEIDLSDIDINKGQTITVPAVVTVDNAGCWIYGSYSVEVSF